MTIAELARLLFEALLLGSAAVPAPSKDDGLLTQAAALCKVDLKALRMAFAKDKKPTHGTECKKAAKKSQRLHEAKR